MLNKYQWEELIATWVIKGCLHPSWNKKIPVFYDSHRLSANSLYIVWRDSAIFLWSRLFEWDVTVPLRTQKQLNPAFDPLPSLVNRKFCGGGGWGVGRGSDCSCSHSLAPPPPLFLPLYMEHTQVYTSELVRHFLAVFLCKRHWNLSMNTENARRKGYLNIWE